MNAIDPNAFKEAMRGVLIELLAAKLSAKRPIQSGRPPDAALPTSHPAAGETWYSNCAAYRS